MLGQVAALRSQTTTIAELHHELCAAKHRALGPALSRDGDPSNGVPSRRGRRTSPSSAWRRCFPARRQRFAVLVQYAPRVRRHHRDSARPLGLAAVLRRRPQGARQDRLEMGRVPARRRVRPDPLRDAPFEPPLDRAGPIDRARGGPDGAGRRRLRRPPFSPRTDGVVLGMGGGAAQLAMGFAFRSYLPMLDTVLPAGGKQAIESCQGLLPEWTEDSFPGFPAQRHGGPDRQSVEPGRVQLHGRRRVRLVAGGGLPGRARARNGRGRHGGPGGRGHRPEPIHLPGIQQDPGVFAPWPLPAVRRRVPTGSSSAKAWPRWCSSAWPTPSATATGSTR